MLYFFLTPTLVPRVNESPLLNVQLFESTLSKLRSNDPALLASTAVNADGGVHGFVALAEVHPLLGINILAPIPFGALKPRVSG